MKKFNNVCLIGENYDETVVKILKDNNIPFEYRNIMDEDDLNIVMQSSLEDIGFGGVADCVICEECKFTALDSSAENLFELEDFSRFVAGQLTGGFRRRENSRLLEKLVRYELEKLGIPKNYAGYGYLLNVLGICVPLPDDAEILMRSMERDLYRLMTRCWNENKMFRLLLSPYLQQEQLKINSKNILKCLKLYVEDVM